MGPVASPFRLSSLRASDRLRLPVIAVSLALCIASVVRAAPEVPGQDAPRFEAALALWLEDDDAAALPEFAALAAEGNRAAQILLAIIDVNSQLHGPWLDALDRKERIALMRSPGGLSGRSWMQSAAAEAALAQLWLETPTATLETALGFAAMGEARAARETLQALAARQFRGFAAAAEDPRYPAELRHLIWREWADDPEGLARVEAEIAALPPGDPQIQRYRARDVDATDLDAWLAVAPLAEPLRAFCSARCPDAPAACARGALWLLDGHAGLAANGSPSETLIPEPVWYPSPRGQAALLRQPYARFRFAEELAAEVTALDKCLAGELAAETGRFAE